MSRDAQIALAVGAVLLIVAVAAGLGLAGTTSTTITHDDGPGVPDPPADGSAGLVFDLRTSGGFNLFGLQIVPQDREAHVGLIVPPECVRQDTSGGEELLTEGVCAGLPLYGELSGGGTTGDGLRLVFVRVGLSRSCYEALAIGDPWPSSAEACAED